MSGGKSWMELVREERLAFDRGVLRLLEVSGILAPTERLVRWINDRLARL